MLSETEKFQSEVRAESERLIKQGVAPWEAAMQAGKNVQQKRKLTKRAFDAAKYPLKTNFTKQDVLAAIEAIFGTPRK